jgi:hypothetical protein
MASWLAKACATKRRADVIRALRLRNVDSSPSFESLCVCFVSRTLFDFVIRFRYCFTTCCMSGFSRDLENLCAVRSRVHATTSASNVHVNSEDEEMSENNDLLGHQIHKLTLSTCRGFSHCPSLP